MFTVSVSCACQAAAAACRAKARARSARNWVSASDFPTAIRGTAGAASVRLAEVGSAQSGVHAVVVSMPGEGRHDRKDTCRNYKV